MTKPLPLRTLFLSPRQAWPVTSGAKLRDYHLARALGEAGSLTYLHFADPAADKTPLPFAERYEALPRPRGYTAGKILRGLAGRWPISVENYLSADMSAKITALALTNSFDLIQLDAIQMAGYLPLLKELFPRVPIVFDWHNIESELMRRYSANVPSIPKRIYAGLTARRLEQLEHSLLRTRDYAHIVCSERERDQLLAIAPAARVAVIPNGVDTEYFVAGPADGRNALVYVGSMNYHANVEGAVYFAKEVWPEVRTRFPQWRLQLVGSNPSQEVLALAGLPGVEVTGTVPDVRPYYRSAVAALVPLLTGGGTRLKILEAMAAGVPVVSTPVGAEGLSVEGGRDILIASSTTDWDHAIQSLTDPSRWHALAQAGRTLVGARYDWTAIGHELIRIYSGWLQASGNT